MPLVEQQQEPQPDLSTHPDYQRLFVTLVGGGQSREQATLLLADFCRKAANNNGLQLQSAPQPRGPPQQQLQHPSNEALQQGPADHNEPEQPKQVQLPHGPQLLHQHPIHNHKEQPAAQHQDHHQQQAMYPFLPGGPRAPQDLLLPTGDNRDWFMPNRVDKHTPQLPPIDLNAKSLTIFLQHPTTYAIEKLRKFEYVPLWYFTEQGFQAADKDKASNEDFWDITETSDNCLSLRTDASNRPSPHALRDEQLTWVQFMDANRLLCRWLIPAGWSEGYAKVLSSFFWQIENHEDIYIADGKETLLLYQARARKAWHDKLKAGHFSNLAKLDEKKMNAYRKEVDARQNAVAHKAVMALLAAPDHDATSSPAGKTKRRRARDASSANNSHLPHSRPHPYKRTGSAPTHSFRPNPRGTGSGPQGP